MRHAGHTETRPGAAAGAVPGQPGGAGHRYMRAHDVRFVEDNWENPTLGAWGLGWEVWMDGALPLASPAMSCSTRCSLPGLCKWP